MEERLARGIGMLLWVMMILRSFLKLTDLEQVEGGGNLIKNLKSFIQLYTFLKIVTMFFVFIRNQSK